jgi:hypothetical protein
VKHREEKQPKEAKEETPSMRRAASKVPPVRVCGFDLLRSSLLPLFGAWSLELGAWSLELGAWSSFPLPWLTSLELPDLAVGDRVR